MTLDSARGSDGCEASPRLPTGLCGSRIRTDDSFYVLCAGRRYWMIGLPPMAKALRALDALLDAPTGLACEAGLPSALSSLVEPMEAAPPAGDQPLVVR